MKNVPTFCLKKKMEQVKDGLGSSLEHKLHYVQLQYVSIEFPKSLNEHQFCRYFIETASPFL